MKRTPEIIALEKEKTELQNRIRGIDARIKEEAEKQKVSVKDYYAKMLNKYSKHLFVNKDNKKILYKFIPIAIFGNKFFNEVDMFGFLFIKIDTEKKTVSVTYRSFNWYIEHDVKCKYPFNAGNILRPQKRISRFEPAFRDIAKLVSNKEYKPKDCLFDKNSIFLLEGFLMAKLENKF